MKKEWNYTIGMVFGTLAFVSQNLASNSETALEETKISSYRVGFEELHAMGLKGKGGSGITVIEPNMSFNPDHPTFKSKEITLIDVGRQPTSPPNFKDSSTFRYKDSFPLSLAFWNLKYHAQGIASILVGLPDEKNMFYGGIVPFARVQLVSFSHVNTSDGLNLVANPMFCAGTSIYSFKEDKIKKHSLKSGTDIPGNGLIDDSIYDAIKMAFSSKARVITGSFNLQSPCDYKNKYLLPKEYLDLLAEGLEKNDQIMIFAAGNTACNISDQIKKSNELYDVIQNYTTTGNCGDYKQEDFERSPWPTSTMDEKFAPFSQQNYFLQYATHPEIKKRFLIVTNVALSREGATLKGSKGKVLLSNSSEYDIGLHDTSCYPGDNTDLQAMTVSAFGNNIVEGGNEDSFRTSNGTSIAVPVVAGLLTLIDEYYLNMGVKKTGPELLKILKKTCILPGEKMSSYYGNGIIDPMGFLKNNAL